MLNYFDLFSLPQQYTIDVNDLTLCYLNKQKETRSAQDDANSSLLNIAYLTLKNPLQRAEYLISLQKKIFDTMPPNLAAKMFDLRKNFDEASNQEKIQFVKELEGKIENLLEQLRKYQVNSSEFFEIFCEAKFLHSFLEKVKNVDDRY